MNQNNNIERIDSLILQYQKGRIGDGEAAELLAWVESDPHNRQYFKEQLAIIRGLSVIEATTYQSKSQSKSRIKKLWWSVAATAAACLLLLLAWPLLFSSTEKMVGKGPITKYILEDGSLVWLAANGTLEKPRKFEANLRQVVLKGNGYFVVSKSKQRPFIIHTDEATIKVVGTRFLVEQAERSCNISVLEGRVKVLAKNSIQTMVGMGEELLVEANASHKKSLAENSNSIKVDGSTVTFTRVRLSDAVKVLSNLFGIPFIVTDKELNNLTLTSKMDGQSVAEVKFVLEQALNVHVKASNDIIAISKK